MPSPQGPARQMHIDLSLEGLEQTLRYCRRDIAEFASNMLEAQDRVAAGEENVRVPRFAAYSVWVREFQKRAGCAERSWSCH